MTGEEQLKHSVLLVDDEPEILFSITGLLRREFDLHTAESATEALAILERQQIHVVMTDQRMPEITGVELMSRVKTDYPDAIRMIFTGYADIKAVIEAINTGGLFRYITKPWDPDELIATLHEAADEYDALVERRRLLADLREHLGRGRRFAEQLDGQATAVGAAELNQFIESSSDLLKRLPLQ